MLVLQLFNSTKAKKNTNKKSNNKTSTSLGIMWAFNIKL